MAVAVAFPVSRVVRVARVFIIVGITVVTIGLSFFAFFKAVHQAISTPEDCT
jgi:hypothetical protein